MANNGDGAAQPRVVPVPRKAYATSEDWTAHRDLITKLYWDEDRTLKAVREYMQLNHGFDATEKMYKWRFKSWGLHKNLTRKDATQIVHHAFGGKAAVLPVIRGRQVGPKKLKDYLCRMTVSKCSSAATMPRALGSPDPWRVPDEGGLTDMVIFTQRRMQNDAFGFKEKRNYDWSGDCRVVFWEDMRLAVASLKSSSSPPPSSDVKGDNDDYDCDKITKPTVDAADHFRLLDRAFSNYTLALDGEFWPVLIWTSIHSVLLLLGQAGAPLAESFVRYASSLCAIKLGRAHVVTRLWALIRSMTLGQFWRAAYAMLNALVTALLTGQPREDDMVRAAVLHAARQLAASGALPFASAAEAFQSIIDEFRDTRGTWVRHEWYLWSRWWHCHAMFHLGRLDLARDGLAALGPLLHGGNRDFAYGHVYDGAPLTMYYALWGRLHAALGEAELATSYYTGAYTLAKLRPGWNARESLQRTSSELRDHYINIGDVEAAERTKREAQAHWEALIGGVSSAREADVVSVDEI
ncbi:Clr5 domain-containing protein [Pestalotiopsis sp. NC0098]|nr:Clr5 domain-containing protein [Pestalotiopsis sp. NC0098]